MTTAKARAAVKTEQQKYNIFLVDDHPVVRFGIRQMIELEGDMSVCGETDNATDALGMIAKLDPDLVVVDLSLKKSNGIDLIKQIKCRGERPRMLVVSMHDERTYAERAIRAGAMGYINKDDATKELVAAIRQVLANHMHLSAEMTGRLLGRAMGRSPEGPNDVVLGALTDRELEIFELMGRGFTTREVAESLFLSVKTVDTYRRHMKTKLKIENNSELTVFAANWVRDNQ